MKKYCCLIIVFLLACKSSKSDDMAITTASILGNPDYPAICYGGYRYATREREPSVADIKEDLKILSALNFKLIRTYNVHYKETENILKAITELKKENPHFDMYLMLGVWIDCKNAWTESPLHDQESERNEAEIREAVRLTRKYSTLVKAIAVGNESMVKWAESYYVSPGIVLKWVNYLQTLKKQKQLPDEVWITSSDNFAAWGGETAYQCKELAQLFRAVDFVSVHTYPMHDTYYNPEFWEIKGNQEIFSLEEKVNLLMLQAVEHAISQYKSVLAYMQQIGVKKPVYIGETGWATQSNDKYGAQGTCAADQFKSARYYQLMREWSASEKISCFFFEAFDESWKDAENPGGVENHFGFFTQNGQAKFAIWSAVDKGLFKGLTRGGRPIKKTNGGKYNSVWQQVKLPSKAQVSSK